ncbi:hypothetical protein NCCP2145_36890 [Pseudarthrobacter sp. NCCP-2145]|nr:hypothetical protein NCCP2145_36890 [Pseudarthrobacter sp. NCCP-2145]
MACHFGVDGIFTQGAQEQLGQSCNHGWVSVSGEVLEQQQAGHFVWVLIYRLAGAFPAARL